MRTRPAIKLWDDRTTISTSLELLAVASAKVTYLHLRCSYLQKDAYIVYPRSVLISMSVCRYQASKTADGKGYG